MTKNNENKTKKEMCVVCAGQFIELVRIQIKMKDMHKTLQKQYEEAIVQKDPKLDQYYPLLYTIFDFIENLETDIESVLVECNNTDSYPRSTICENGKTRLIALMELTLNYPNQE